MGNVNKHKEIFKLHTHGGVQFVVFVKFTCAYLHQIVPEIMELLMKNLPEKTSQEVKTDRILTPHKLFL